MNEAIILAMLKNPEQAEQILEWCQSEEGQRELAVMVDSEPLRTNSEEIGDIDDEG